ncbi:SsrA-binding protein SmpB [Salinispira pacifica]|uniref:SsrA-binding protein n=1 Tax=Salinispira pacifica TaxID=1307761 RepID=V5WI38_9SPIO|nr:SsrA-binding protein SmpB [Salinispira pacifica]AHC15209.1 tmRNA-binding protein SmpB [Salinispira pacifica]
MAEGTKLLSKNRRAFHEYHILERYECGIMLAGTEVKSMKSGKYSFVDSYARIKNNELWLVGLHITPYDHGNIHNHEPVRDRKLLVNRDELTKLVRKTDEKGLTLVPLSFYLKGGLVKMELGVCRGKKLHDKRASIKEKDLKRQSEREMRGRI